MANTEEDATELTFPKEWEENLLELSAMELLPDLSKVAVQDMICDNCKIKLSGHYINCGKCSSTKVCLNCFSTGAEFGSHESNHGYTIETTDVVLHGSWDAKDELMLLEYISEHGFDNWTTIANRLQRTPSECREHYYTHYVNEPIGELEHLWQNPINKEMLTVHTEGVVKNGSRHERNVNEDGENLWTAEYINNMCHVQH